MVEVAGVAEGAGCGGGVGGDLAVERLTVAMRKAEAAVLEQEGRCPCP